MLLNFPSHGMPKKRCKGIDFCAHYKVKLQEMLKITLLQSLFCQYSA